MEKSKLSCIKYPHAVLLRFWKRNVYARRISVSIDRNVCNRGKLSERQFLSTSAKMSDPLKNPFEPFFEEVRRIVREEIAAVSKETVKLLHTTNEAAELCNVKSSWLAWAARSQRGELRRALHGETTGSLASLSSVQFRW